MASPKIILGSLFLIETSNKKGLFLKKIMDYGAGKIALF
jgi:hypothetical protein